MQSARTVIIVGAGPAGASLGYLLARAGVDVTLLERQTDFSREFRGEGLLPNGMAALREMDLLSDVERLPRVIIERAEILLNGRPLFELDVSAGRFDGVPACVLSQPALLELFASHSARYSNFRLERGVKVIDLVRADDRIAGVRLRAGDREIEMRADLVIGTDGRSSTVRRLAGLEPRASTQSFNVVWCKVPRYEVDGIGRIRFYLGDGHWAVVYPSHDGRLQIGWIIRAHSFGDLTGRSATEWLRKIADHVSGTLGRHLRTLAEDQAELFFLHVMSNRAPSWTKPGLLLLGDAAHPMSPIGAQGINVALSDVIVAANHLRPVLAGDHAIAEVDAASRAVERDRKREIAAVQRLQSLPPKLLLGHSLPSRVVTAMLLPLSRIGALPMLYRLAMKRMALGRPVRLKPQTRPE